MTSQKSSHHRYTIIPRTLIFLRHGNRVLLIKGAPEKKLWANLYNGVGGHIEKGEDIFNAARRELTEETGIFPDNLYLCGTIMVDTGDEPGIGIFVFTGSCHTIEVKSSAEGYLEWVDPDHTTGLDMVEDLPVLLPMVMRWKPGQPPFSALYRTDPAQAGWKISFAK